jgi:ferredoxin
MRPRVLVVGSGRSVLIAAEEVAAQGGKASLLCPERRGFEGLPDGAELLDEGEIVDLEGSPGRFRAMIKRENLSEEVRVDSIIVAVDRRPSGPRAGAVALSAVVPEELPETMRSILIVLGKVAPRSAHRQALDLAMKLASSSPDRKVHIVTAEVLVHGADELLYFEAQKAGVMVVRTASDVVPDENNKITIIDEPSGLRVELAPDLQIVEGADDKEVSAQLTGPLGALGDPTQVSVARGPASTLREGVFTCGSARYDRTEEELDQMARAAATMAMTRSRPERSEEESATVDQDKCSACLTCVRSCPFGAPRIGEEGKAEVQKVLCQACGICVSACPSRAISLPSDDNLPSPIVDLTEAGP